MGGAPYSSLACPNCRKSKVRCDLEKPECRRCTKRGLPCPGYPERRWIRSRVWESAYEKHEWHSHALEGPTTSQPKTSLTRAVSSGPELRIQISSSFIMDYFPTNVDGAAGVGSLYRILSHALELPSISPMLEKALSALSCIHFGKTKYDEPMLRYGIELYNEAIGHLVKNLSRNRLDVDALYTSIVFQLLECVHCSRGLKAWLSHVEGTSKMVRSCYQRLSGSPIEQAIYNHQKLALMYSAATVSEEFTSHYSRLLSTPVVGPVDELFELYAGISSLFNKVERTPILNNETAEEMMSACLVQRDKVVKWYLDRGEILGEFPHCCSPESLPCDGLPKSDKIFGLPYMFSDLDTMCNYVLYWTACLLIELLIYGVSTSIMALGRGRRQSNFAMRHIEYCLIAEQYADNFVRSLPFCLQTGMNAWGANVIIASMKHVYKPYVALRREEKFQWCQKALQVMSDRGMSLAEVVSNAGQDVWDHYEPPSLIRKTNVHPQDIAALPIAPNELSPDSRSSNDSAQGSPPRPPISVLGNKRKSGIITCHETSTDSPFE